MADENLKFLLSNYMQSFASIVLEALVGQRNSSARLEQGTISGQCRDKLIQVSASALKNQQWALQGETDLDVESKRQSFFTH